MRGFLEPAVRYLPSDTQRVFRSLSRNRRMKLAKQANTTLIKADQWARGDAVAPEIAAALDRAVSTRKTK